MERGGQIDDQAANRDLFRCFGTPFSILSPFGGFSYSHFCFWKKENDAYPPYGFLDLWSLNIVWLIQVDK